MNKKVYKAIGAITEELSKVGIAKDQRNQQQNYSFRGIDAVYNVLSGLLAQHQLCILPRVVEHHVAERQSKKGDALFCTTVKVEFDLVSAEDGSKHTVATIGEAMDNADKSSNKAQSAAYKYMAFQVFCIPVEGELPDADAETHQVQGQRENPRGVLTVEQVKEIEALTKQTGRSIAAICKRAGVASIELVPSHFYGAIIDGLKKPKGAATQPEESHVNQ